MSKDNNKLATGNWQPRIEKETRKKIVQTRFCCERKEDEKKYHHIFRSLEMCGISSVKYCITNASISWHDSLARIGDSYSSYFVRCFFKSVLFLRSYVKYLSVRDIEIQNNMYPTKWTKW